MNKQAIAISFLLMLACIATGQQHWSVSSPDKKIRLEVEWAGNKLFYMVQLNNVQAIGKSALGVYANEGNFADGLRVAGESRKFINESYTMAVGKRLQNTAQANELTLDVVNGNNKKAQFVFRAYNNGFAYAYRFPKESTPLTITGEASSFALGKGKAWLQPYGLPYVWGPAYEDFFLNGIPIGTPAEDSSGYSFPGLFNSNGIWLLVSEAGLDEHYFGSHFAANCSGEVYKLAPPLQAEDHGMFGNAAYNTDGFTTPWRMAIIAEKLAGIMESNLVHHLSKPNAIGDFSWVKPGNASWSWWSDHSSSKDFNKLKKFVDLAAYIGWPYSLVDANWNIMQGGDIEQLVSYAKSRGIGLSLWYNSGGPHNTITEEPRNRMHEPSARQAEMKKLNQWGIKAIKVDFFQSDKQDIIKLYLDILKDAAQAKLMVDFHGCTLPRGWARTYPNLVTMEGVRGAEQYGWDTVYVQRAPWHNTVLAFTRNAVGSMDYTPVTFSSYPGRKHITTNAHELAQSVVFESGIQHFADSDSAYRAQSAAVRSFLGSVPSAWDDTKFLDGYPGKLVMFARRKGNDWYIGCQNGEVLPKIINVNLSFLAAGDYNINILSDGLNGDEIASNKIIYKPGSKLQVKVLPRGGFVMQVKKQ